MGHKVNPIGFRLGIVHDWHAKWYADRQFAQFLKEDLKLRQALREHYPDAGISRIEIERQANQLSLSVHTARPGIVIGRGGQRVEEIRLFLENLTGKRVRLNIEEIREPELDAYLVARSIADQIRRRVSYRRAMKQTTTRTTQAGAKGIKVICSGRLAGAEIARRESVLLGRVPLHTLRANIDYGFAEARTTVGRIGVKVWIYKGDIPGPGSRAREMALAEEAFATEAGVSEIVGTAPPAPEAGEMERGAAPEADGEDMAAAEVESESGEMRDATTEAS